MNGAFDRLQRVARLPRWATSRQVLGRFGVPAMAIVGVGAITAILLGLQCGGLDKCLAGKPAVAAVASIAPAAEPTAAPDVAAPVAQVVEVAMTRAPEVPEAVVRARRADDMIGDTFVALASDDAGWLAGAVASAAETQVYDEGDGAGPPPSDETAVEAATAAAGDTPGVPLQRPEPLDVAAFAEEPAETAASVKAAAEQQLAEVAKPEPAVESEPAAEPEQGAEPEPAAEPAAKPEPDPEPAKAVASGDTRTIGGSGVNVRSGPGKSNGKLFALAGGEKVTVGENRRGWLKITDDQGRSGWIYKSYLN